MTWKVSTCAEGCKHWARLVYGLVIITIKSSHHPTGGYTGEKGCTATGLCRTMQQTDPLPYSSTSSTSGGMISHPDRGKLLGHAPLLPAERNKVVVCTRIFASSDTLAPLDVLNWLQATNKQKPTRHVYKHAGSECIARDL